MIEKLKELEALIWYDAGEGPKSGYSPCDDVRFREALRQAWPKLLAVVDLVRPVLEELDPRWMNDLSLPQLQLKKAWEALQATDHRQT